MSGPGLLACFGSGFGFADLAACSSLLLSVQLLLCLNKQVVFGVLPNCTGTSRDLQEGAGLAGARTAALPVLLDGAAVLFSLET